jgi:hypothetical protein
MWGKPRRVQQVAASRVTGTGSKGASCPAELRGTVIALAEVWIKEFGRSDSSPGIRKKETES